MLKKKRKILAGFVCRIDKVGIELEGGWRTLPKGHRDVVHDGSVKFDELRRAAQEELDNLIAANALTSTKQEAILAKIPTYVGEIVSKPLRIEDINDWIQECYPSSVNETCGLHIHMSFLTKLHYQRLMNREFAEEWLVGEIRKWANSKGFPKNHPIWDRINDPNHRHCAHKYLGHNQIGQTRKDYNSRGTENSRYTAVNYCYAQHGTLECRVLPMFSNIDDAKEAIHLVITATNRYLAKNRLKERNHRIVIPEMAPKELLIESQI